MTRPTPPKGVDAARRRLLRYTAGSTALAAGVTSGLSACGGGGDSGTTAPLPDDSAPPTPTPPVNPPTYPPPSAAEGLPSQFLTWDGDTGTNRTHWNRGIRLAWRNPNVGDWRDASGTAQGSVPFATARFAAAGTQALDVTELVRQQAETGNRGFFLKATGTDFSIDFAGRLAPDAPTLRVETSSGVFDLPCIATAYWALGSGGRFNGQTVFKVQRQMHHAIIQFDYAQLSGSIRSASLSLTTATWRRVTTVEIYACDPPQFDYFEDEASGGLASAFRRDIGIESHPSVLFASDFTDLGKWDRARKISNASLITDSNGLPALRCLTPAGDHSGIGLSWFLMRGTSPGGPPDRVVDEAYFRYYLTLEDDWRSEVDANKTPGFDCRQGVWQAMGYWENLGGNGGSPNDGRRVVFASGANGYRGHMIRGHSSQQLTDGNPYSELVWLGTYNYHIDQADFFGDAERWDDVVIRRGERVCIEWHVRMNSLTGPADELGNREAVADGLLEVWVNGRQVQRWEGLRWRRHPALGVAAIDMSMYHGGTQPAPRDMHCRFDHVVVATEYIGPLVL